MSLALAGLGLMLTELMNGAEFRMVTVLLSGGAAVATGGLSVLARAAWTRLSRAQDPCEELAKEGKEQLGDQFPDLVVEITEPPAAPQPVPAEQGSL